MVSDPMEQRMDRVEGGYERVVVILEGEPVLDIDGTKIGTTGGVVRQGERNAEALNIISHQLDGIQTQLSPHRWTRNQRIKVFGIAATTLVGSLSVVVWGF